MMRRPLEAGAGLPAMRVLMLAPARIPGAQILELAFRGLAARGAIAFRPLYDSEAMLWTRAAAVQRSDVVFLFRCYTPWSLRLLRFAKRLGKPVIYCADDDFRELDPATPLGRLHHDRRNRAAYESLFREADLVWLFTEEMKRRYEVLNGRIVIGRLPSFVELNHPGSLEDLEVAERQRCVIGYGSSAARGSDWQPLVGPLLRVLDSYANVRAQFVGYAPDELARHPKARVVPLIGDLLGYYEFLRGAPWSIGLAPLEDTPFRRGKTNNKYREYAGLGIPGIYSDMPVYASCVEHGVTGYLTPHSPEGFLKALTTMIEDPGLRARIRRGALQDAASTYALEGVQLQLLHEISLLAIRTRYRGWRPPRLLLVGFDDSASTHIGALQPCRCLAREGLLEFSWVRPRELGPRDLEGVDAVYVLRAFQPELLWLIESARRAGLPVISAWDDDFLSMSPETRLGRYYAQPAVVDAVKRFLAESAVVVASTGPLAERSRALNAHVLEGIYGLDALGLAEAAGSGGDPGRADGRVRIGYFGVNVDVSASIHAPWVIEALRSLRVRYGEKIVLETIGAAPPSELRELVDWFAWGIVPYEESMRLLKSRGWDVGLAPLEGTRYNAAKQATKFRDYAWAGAAIVCSKVPTYERCLIDGVHCVFAENTARAWEDGIASLIEDFTRTEYLKRGARRLLGSVHTQTMTNATWQQLVWRLGVVSGPGHSSDPSRGTGARWVRRTGPLGWIGSWRPGTARHDRRE